MGLPLLMDPSPAKKRSPLYSHSTWRGSIECILDDSYDYPEDEYITEEEMKIMREDDRKFVEEFQVRNLLV